MAVWAALVVPTDWLENSSEVGFKKTLRTPVPDRFKAWGLVLASSVTVTVPVSDPTVVGVKVMLIEQLLLAARVVTQPVAAKSPVVATLVMFRGTDWLLVRVTVLALLVVLMAWLEKRTVPLGESVTGFTPEPAKAAVCGLLLASSVTVKVPERLPSAEGVNVMLIAQLLRAARGEGQPLAAKSPVVVMPLMFRATV